MSATSLDRSWAGRLLAGIACCWAPAAVCAQEFAPGERVVVIGDRVPIRSGDQVVDVVDRGELLTVANSKGPWLLAGRGRSGWIDKSSVVAAGAALEHFNRAVAARPQDFGARAARAAVWNSQQAWDSAIAESSQALALNPGLWQARLVRSAAARGKHDFAAALADAQAVVRSLPGVGWGYVAVGDVFYDQGDFDRAVAEYSAALERDRLNAHWYLRRGKARLASSRSESWKAAGADFGEAINLAEHDPACQREAQLARGQSWIQRGDYERARAEFTVLLAENKDDVQALIGRGTAAGYARQYEIALPDLDEAVWLEPKNPQVYLARGEIRNRQYNTRGALRDADQAIALTPDSAAAHRLRGEALSRGHKWELAIVAYGRAIGLQPANAKLYLARAAAYDRIRNAVAAADDRRRAGQLDPSLPANGEKSPAEHQDLSTAAKKLFGIQRE